MTTLNIDDVRALDVALDSDVEATRIAWAACPNITPSDALAFAGFYASWKTEHEKFVSYDTASWWNWGARIDEVLLLDQFEVDFARYDAQLQAWQARLAAACPSYQAPPPPISPQNNLSNPLGDLAGGGSGAGGGTDWGTVVKYGVIGLLGLVVIHEVGLPHLFGKEKP